MVQLNIFWYMFRQNKYNNQDKSDETKSLSTDVEFVECMNINVISPSSKLWTNIQIIIFNLKNHVILYVEIDILLVIFVTYFYRFNFLKYK